MHAQCESGVVRHPTSRPENVSRGDGVRSLAGAAAQWKDRTTEGKRRRPALAGEDCPSTSGPDRPQHVRTAEPCPATGSHRRRRHAPAPPPSSSPLAATSPAVPVDSPGMSAAAGPRSSRGHRASRRPRPIQGSQAPGRYRTTPRCRTSRSLLTQHWFPASVGRQPQASRPSASRSRSPARVISGSPRWRSPVARSPAPRRRKPRSRAGRSRSGRAVAHRPAWMPAHAGAGHVRLGDGGVLLAPSD
jgi:hypothetical protein